MVTKYFLLIILLDYNQHNYNSFWKGSGGDVPSHAMDIYHLSKWIYHKFLSEVSHLGSFWIIPQEPIGDLLASFRSLSF